jgi:putative cell wall-binding protein
VAALPLAVALLSTAATATSDPSQYVPSRIRGASRFHTAANIATQAFDQADVAHLATGTSYPDALAGSFAAGSVDGPLLLSARDRLPRPTREALAALSVERVVIIGGTAAISQNVADELADAGYATDRVDGANRFQTASSVARRYGRQQVGTVDGQRVAILATGAHFADALAAGPIAASARVPLLLTPRDRPADSVTTALGRLDIDKILLLGGSQAISPDVAGFYRDRGYDVERIGGPTLMDTAGLVADTAIADFNFTPHQVLLARGDAYPDALAASVYGATTGSPVMLSATSTELSGPTSQWLTRHCPDVGWVTALGGVNAISQDVRPQAADAANACQEVAAEESAVALTADGQVAVVDTTTGKPLRQLMSVPTDDWANNDLAVTPDRRTAFVTRPGSAEQPTDIARVPVSGGEPEIVATDASSPAVSPDGETLAYIVHRYPQPGDPDPRIVLRDLSSGQQVMLDSGGDWHYVSELAWTADGERLAFVSGEVMTGVATIDADATSMAQASQVGPPLDGSADRRWTSVAGFEQGLAVVDRCCDLAQPRQWRVLHAGLDGTIHGTLIADGRLEASRVTSNADGSALLAVVDGGPDGGQLVRWNGAGQAHTVTGDVIEAAW